MAIHVRSIAKAAGKSSQADKVLTFEVTTSERGSSTYELKPLGLFLLRPLSYVVHVSGCALLP